jgi:hypothetical protein
MAIVFPKNYATGALGVDFSNPLATGLDIFIIPNGSYAPRNLVTNQLLTGQGAFGTGGSARSFASINEGGNGYYSDNISGTGDRFDATLSVIYGQQHSGLVIAKHNTIVPSLFPELMYLDGNDGNNKVRFFTRHSNNLLFCQVTITGAIINYSTSAAAVVPSAMQAFAYTFDGTVTGQPKLYVDGQLRALNAASDTATPIKVFPSSRISLMNTVTAGAANMQGYCFAWLHWNRVLTDTEIAKLTNDWPLLIRYK